MIARTLEKLKYFSGKVCSIITTSMNRNFDERIAREHFVVYVEEITPDGIWGTHPYNRDLVSYFSMGYIISIHEELVLDPDNNEQHAAMIKEFENKSGQKAKSDIVKYPPKNSLSILKEKPITPTENGDATFVDINALEQLAENTKKTYDNLPNHK